MSRISIEGNHGGQQKTIWSRKNEEFIADFTLVSRRVLNDFEHRIFKFHFLLGADWRLCCRKLGMDRGNFFHEVYRIEQRLGRVFRELQPYGLYPLDEYFGGATREAEARTRVEMSQQEREFSRPLALVAEELPQQLRALGAEHALHDLHSMVQQVRIGNAEFAAHAAEAEIAGGEHQAAYSSLHKRSRAHDAWFQRHVKDDVFQTVVPHRPRGFAQSDHLGVSGGVVQADG